MSSKVINKTLIQKIWPREIVSLLPEVVVVSTNSRTMSEGDIFFAQKGEIHDGHDFIEEALNKGASLIVANDAKRQGVPNSKKIYFVQDTFSEFFRLVREHLMSMPAIKIAITGSNGKTTTKEMVKAVLSHVYKEASIYANPGNKNNHFGLPQSALEVNAEHRIAIFEMGMNGPGEIKKLCGLVQPTIGLITNIDHAHEGNFLEGINGVQKAKGELFESIAQEDDGWAIVNLDDERVVTESNRWPAHSRITFGVHPQADVRLLKHEVSTISPPLQSVTVMHNEESISFSLPILGEHNAHNATAVLAMLAALKLPLKEASLGFLTMKKTKGRFFVHQTKNGVTVIDDGYNANPTSVAVGIKTSLQFPNKRRIGVIGAMGELGENSPHHHENLGKLLAHHFDYLFFCGKDTKHTIKGAVDEGFNEASILYKDSSLELIEPVKAILKEGDLIFVKGSLSANMSAVTEALTVGN